MKPVKGFSWTGILENNLLVTGRREDLLGFEISDGDQYWSISVTINQYGSP